MQYKSQLVELQLIDDKGSISTYYTYDGYYDQNDRIKIREYRRKIEKRTFTSACIASLLTFYTSKKMETPSIYYKGSKIPSKGLLSGVVGFGVAYLLFDFIGTHQLADLQTNVALSSHHLPLWKNKRFAVNPDRAFFELVDSDNNQLSIFHSGLTPEAAARIIPDKIIGSVPKKPEKPQ